MTLFHPVKEGEVTKAIVGSFLRHFEQYVESDVIIVGSAPSELVAGMPHHIFEDVNLGVGKEVFLV